jgi:hypothetical protein
MEGLGLSLLAATVVLSSAARDRVRTSARPYVAGRSSGRSELLVCWLHSWCGLRQRGRCHLTLLNDRSAMAVIVAGLSIVMTPF